MLSEPVEALFESNTNARQYMHSVRLMLFGESVCVAGMTGVGVGLK